MSSLANGRHGESSGKTMRASFAAPIMIDKASSSVLCTAITPRDPRGSGLSTRALASLQSGLSVSGLDAECGTVEASSRTVKTVEHAASAYRACRVPYQISSVRRGYCSAAGYIFAMRGVMRLTEIVARND